MKKEKISLSVLLVVALFIGCISFISCGEEEKEVTPPEVAVNEEVYYIVGKVQQDNGTALADVDVSTSGQSVKTDAQGIYELPVTGKGTYAVAFTKANYISVSSKATIASNAGIFSSVILTQTLTAKSAPVSVTPNSEAKIEELTVPAGGVDAPVEISVTKYADATVCETSNPNEINAPVATFDFEPDGLVFAEPAIVTIPNPLTGGAAFSSLTHLVLKNNTWTEEGLATYNQEGGHYTFELKGFSKHSFIVPSVKLTTTTSEEPIGQPVVIDNTGNQAVQTQDITTSQKYGWEVAAPQVDEALKPMVSAVLGGGNSGTGEIPLTFPYTVSGDTKATIEVVATVTNTKITLPIIGSTRDISVKKYTGTKIVIKLEYGSSWTDHSGGGAQ
ncbi:MAG: hypothetical protein LBQ39_02935 [Tannerellaceae bacterium]|jgi:hypothetical protein|nr:hypothetical protein [Tannerellaceae bacterium]